MTNINKFSIELLDPENEKLKNWIREGKYRSKVEAIRDLIRRAE